MEDSFIQGLICHFKQLFTIYDDVQEQVYLINDVLIKIIMTYTYSKHINSCCIFLFLQVVTGCETKNKYRVCNSMSQQVYFAQEGMLVQFHDVGYFAIYFYYQEFVAKNLGM